jgi:hypothetical protein
MASPAASAAACLAFLLVALPAAARAEDDPNAFTIVSPNAEFELAQASEGGSCKVEVKRGSTLAWAAKRCFGDRNDGHFLSNDGSTLLVVHSFPSQKAGVKAARGVSTFVRGAPLRSLEIGRFVRDVKPLVMARAHFYWLEGALGQRGVPPGFSKDGQAVELTTLDRRSWSVGFDGTLKKIDMPKPLGR